MSMVICKLSHLRSSIYQLVELFPLYGSVQKLAKGILSLSHLFFEVGIEG